VLSSLHPDWFDLTVKVLDFIRDRQTGRDHRPAARRAPGYSLPRSVRRAIEYIHANLTEDARLEDIAGAAG